MTTILFRQALSATFFLSVFASTLFYLGAATFIEAKTGSTVFASLAFAAPLLLPVISAPLIRKVVRSLSPQALFAWTMGLMCFLYLVCSGFPQMPPAIAISVTLFGGLLDGCIRVGRLVAAKIMDAGRVAGNRLVPQTFLLQFLASGTAGLVMMILPRPISISHVFLASSMCAALAVPISFALPRSKPGVGDETLSRQIVPRRLAVPFWRFILFGSAAQAFFNATRVALPTAFGMQSAIAIGLYQIGVSVGAISGALALLRLGVPRSLQLERWLTLAMSLAAATAVTASAMWISLPAYVLFILFFEVIFIARQSALNDLATRSEIASLASYQYSFGYLGVLGLTVLDSWIAEKLSLFVACGFAMGLAAVAMLMSRTENEERLIGESAEAVNG